MSNINDEFIAQVEANDLDAVARLLELGADVHIYDNYALQHSAIQGNLNMVSKLLKYNANLHTDNDGALRWSAKRGLLNVVEKLLDCNANINAGDGTHVNSALEYGVENDHLNVVIKLLERGANVHVKDDNALLLSIKYGRIKIMEELLENGADIYCQNKQILKKMQKNFNESIADIILPYCCTDDYEYFPDYYIREKIVLTKNANSGGASTKRTTNNE